MQVDASVPLFGYIGRLEEQKGVDILIAALPKAIQADNIQVAILGTGQQLSCTVSCIAVCMPLFQHGVMLTWQMSRRAQLFVCCGNTCCPVAPQSWVYQCL